MTPWNTLTNTLWTLEAQLTAWVRPAIDVFWQSALTVLFVVALVTLAKRWPSPVRHALLLVALAKFAIPPLLPSPVGLFPWLGETRVSIEALLPAGEALAPVPAPATPAAVSGVAELPSPVVPWRSGLLILFCLGSAAHGYRLWAQYRSVRTLVAGAESLEPDDPAHHRIDTLWRRALEELGVERPPTLLFSSQPQAAPVAFGTVRPTIVLPRHLVDGLDDRALTAVLAHELAHHVRGDLWVQGFQNLLGFVWWFNPFFHGLGRVIRSTREDCCDDLLLARGLVGDRDYCDVLLDAAELTPAAASVGLGLAEPLHPLARRLRRILDRSLQRTPRLSTTGALGVALVALWILPGRLVGDEAPVVESPEQIAEATAESTMGRLFLAQAFDHLPSGDALNVDGLTYADGALTVDGLAATTTDLVQWLEGLNAQQAWTAEPSSVIRDGEGFRFQIRLEPDPGFYATTEDPSGGDPSGGAPSGGVPSRQTVGGPAEGMQLLGGALRRPGVELHSLVPGARRSTGSMDTWPIEVHFESSLDLARQVVQSLAQAPGMGHFERLHMEALDGGQVSVKAAFQLLLDGDSGDSAVDG